MPTYDTAPAKVTRLLERMMKKHQPELMAAKVAVSMLMARARLDANSEPMGHALKLHGRSVLATVKITSLKDRALGIGDAVIVLDGDRWEGLGAKVQAALLDHELEHLQVLWDTYPDKESGTEGVPRRDDLDRPRLKMRKHDWELAGFDSIVQRHGRAAVEAQQIEHLQRDHKESVFPLFEGIEADKGSPDVKPLGLVGSTAAV